MAEIMAKRWLMEQKRCIDGRCEVMKERSNVCCCFAPANFTLTPYHVVHAAVAKASKYSVDYPIMLVGWKTCHVHRRP